MLLDIPKFIYHQSPVFWYALAATFFLLGLLYANVAWRSSKRRLRRAEREQTQLLGERAAARTDRQRDQQRQNWPLASQPTKPTQIAKPTPPPAEHHSNYVSAQPIESPPTQTASFASMFSSTYQSREGIPSNENGNGNGNGEATNASRSTNRKHAVRPNPWIDYT